MSADWSYPDGSVRAVLASPHVSSATAAVLRERLDNKPDAAPDLLTAICNRLLPQPDRAVPINVAGMMQQRLDTGVGDGWRYATLSTDAAAWAQGLAGIEDTAHQMFGNRFALLAPADQDLVLHNVQRDAPRFFEEMLTLAVECYYAHPLASEEIGYVGMADVGGWTAIGLDEHEPREPVGTRK